MFSVIVPTMWRAWETFENQLFEMIKHPNVSEIILIDNDIDHTPNYDSSPIHHPKVKIHSFRHNIYVNPAWNFGVQEAQEDNICILNDDLIFDIRVFDVIEPRLLDDFNYGIIGLDALAPANEPTVVQIGKNEWPFGFGCMMFMNKRNYYPIPNDLRIYWGDSYLLLKVQKCRPIGVIRGVCDLLVTGKTTETFDLTLTTIAALEARVWMEKILPTLPQ